MDQRQRLFSLILIMASVATLVAGVAIYILYEEAFDNRKNDLQLTLSSQARLLEAVAKYDQLNFGEGTKEEAWAATISQFKEDPKDRFVVMTERRGDKHQTPLENTVYIGADPLKRASFLHAVAIAAGRASPDIDFEDDEALEPLATPLPTLEESEAEGRLLLLAEDNKTNQLVIKKQLNRIGYNCILAEDGKLALEALERNNFGLLLTDCHMPNMDGHELTKTIRAREKETGKKLPIIAVTASVLSAEVDKCYASGMDDFLSKPVDIRELKLKINKFLGKAETSNQIKDIVVENPSTTESTESVIQISALIDLIGDDPEMIKEILEDFIDPTKETIEALNLAYKDKDPEGIGREAHKLKSSTKTIGANDLSALCLELEIAGKEKNWNSIETLHPKLTPLSEAVFADISERLKS